MGAKISLKGYNVNNCANYQLLFSSSWPLLKIEQQGSFTINNTSQNVTIATHNLGYPPLYLYYDTSGTRSSFNMSSVMGIDNNNLKWLGADRWFAPGVKTVYYYIFRLNMSVNFTAPILTNPPSIPETIDNYIFAITKAGKDVSSTDLRDFVVHSSARSMQIHSVNYFEKNSINWTEIIHHNLGYDAFFLFYAASGQDWFLITSGNTNIKGYSLDNNRVQIGASFTGKFSCIIFKDPYSLTG